MDKKVVIFNRKRCTHLDKTGGIKNNTSPLLTQIKKKVEGTPPNLTRNMVHSVDQN